MLNTWDAVACVVKFCSEVDVDVDVEATPVNVDVDVDVEATPVDVVVNVEATTVAAEVVHVCSAWAWAVKFVAVKSGVDVKLALSVDVGITVFSGAEDIVPEVHGPESSADPGDRKIFGIKLKY